MSDTKCPICGSRSFYVKSPEDEYEICEFDVRDGEIFFNSEGGNSEAVAIDEQTDTYCNRCAWHGEFNVLKPK